MCTASIGGGYFGADIPEMHRNIFRGKYLGDHLTDEQRAAIAAGTFADLYIGDYWIINGIIWRIVDINYWYGSGDKSCTTYHVVVMPDNLLYNQAMGSSNTTQGGYALSEMRQTGLDRAKDIVTTAFGTTLLSHRIIISNATANGHVSGRTWVDSTLEICSEWQIYGAPVYAALNDGVTCPDMRSVDCKQFALMRAVPLFINPSRQWYWLRDIMSASNFAAVSNYCCSINGNAAHAGGVRPAFGIIGA